MREDITISSMALHDYLACSAKQYPDRAAIEEPQGDALTYGELEVLANRLRDRLVHLGVQPGDRVGIYMPKSADAIVSIFGILKAGAAYVPVDPDAPASRNAYIHNDCSVRAVLIEKSKVENYRAEFERLGTVPSLLELEGVGGGSQLKALLARLQEEDAAGTVSSATPLPDDLAYILYTSGSTGKPKGVMLSHRNAASFVEWCSETFALRSEDRFSSHAPLHFDLSILDVYVSLKHGGTLMLIGEELGKDPTRLAAFIAEKRISVWYSAPSILSLLTQFGKMEKYDYSALRIVFFAGEVFPVKHLRALKAIWSHPRYFNLYGPTETNVCTYYEVPQEIPADRTQPFPIGKVCSHLRDVVLNQDGDKVAAGEEGELCIAGAGVMRGYWNLPERTDAAFRHASDGERWYKTGDIVITDENGDYLFVGRRDRMVKKRGYRVELGEIEACLHCHPLLSDAAVIAQQEEDTGVRIRAFLSAKEGTKLSLIALKRFCAERLPLYMVPDLFTILPNLPKTSTAKIDYQSLKEMS